jgi:hypothetical protein
MTEVRLRARSVSEVVDAAFALYRQDASQYILVMAVASIPQLVFNLFVHVDKTPVLATIAVTLATALISVLTYTVGAAAIIKFGAASYLGQPADLTEAVRSVIPKLGTIIVAGFLKALLYVVGLFCLVVGAFYVSARFFALTPAIVLEDADVTEAFSRSSSLSDGRKSHVLWTLLLVWFIYVLVSICVGVLAGVTGSEVVKLMAATAYAIVAYPVLGLTYMVLYYDCRIRGEGFDIQQMAASMDRGHGAASGVAGATT